MYMEVATKSPEHKDQISVPERAVEAYFRQAAASQSAFLPIIVETTRDFKSGQIRHQYRNASLYRLFKGVICRLASLNEDYACVFL
jgi:acyl-CoA synthetase (NDP forming)